MTTPTSGSAPAPGGLPGLSLRKNISWTFVGNMVYTGCQWGMLVALSKLGSPAMVGQLALGLAITAPVIMFSNLQLRVVQVTDARDEFHFPDYASLRVITTLLALALIAGVVALSGYRVETVLVVALVSLAKAFEAMSDVFYGMLQKYERMDRIALSLMIKGPASLLALAGTVWLTGSIVWGAAALALTWALVLFLFDIPNGRHMWRATTTPAERQAWQFNSRTLLRLSWLALPLGIVMMLISLNTNLPRYFIEEYLGESELGIFAALSYLIIAGQMVVNALGEAASPRLARSYAAADRAGFQSLLLKLLAVGGALGVAAVGGAMLLGTWVLAILYQPEYARPDLFTLLMVAAALSYLVSFLGYAMTAARYFRIQTVLFLVATVATGVGCLVFIPIYGLLGAAYALIASAIVQGVGSLAIVLYALWVIRPQPNDDTVPGATEETGTEGFEGEQQPV